MRDDIDDLLLNALSFCLDEYAVGGATPSSLDAFVGERPMKVAIEHFQTQEGQQKMFSIGYPTEWQS